MNKERGILGSVSRKYGFGYAMLAVVSIALLFVSGICNKHIVDQYRNTTDELLEFNELYVDVEAVNNCANTAYLYLREDSFRSYTTERKQIDDALKRVKQNIEQRYSREMTDTVCTVETYLNAADHLIGLLKDYTAMPVKSGAYHLEIEKCYGEVQKILGYVTLSFQEAYSTKLVSVRQTQQEFERLQRKLDVLQVFFLAVCVAICFGYCIKIIKGITRSIKRLTESVQSIERDVYTHEPVVINSNDELDDFASALNHMMDVIQAQVTEIRENADIKEKLSGTEIENLRIYGELQKSQLRLLQSRINPHFLFNTLNMISSLARIEDAPRSAELMETAAAYLRYNLDNLSKSVTLKQEISNLEDYVSIQKCRFEDRYQYEFEIEPSCEKFVMPPMILQPLVENSIRHGLIQKLSGGKIWIRAYKVNDNVYLEVEDNGVGMIPEKISELNHSIRENIGQSEHIGLRNIYMRLQYFYSTDVDFLIESRNERTMVRIILPNEGEKMYVDNDYCG